MADAELHKLQQTILPSHQRLLISVLEELDQQKTNRQTVVEEHREVYVRLESEQVNLLALTRTVEAEEKRRERLMNAHRLMVHELEVLRMEAAIKLQSRWRGRLRFLRYHRIRSATISIQHAWRRFICRKNARIRAEQERLRKAATRIQAVFRSFRIRKKYLAVCAQFANRQPVVDFPITRNSKLLVADLSDDYEQLEGTE
jgi:hypothetical protein